MRLYALRPANLDQCRTNPAALSRPRHSRRRAVAVPARADLSVPREHCEEESAHDRSPTGVRTGSNLISNAACVYNRTREDTRALISHNPGLYSALGRARAPSDQLQR